jgi:hypothetical protein
MPEVMRGQYQKFNGIFLKDQSSNRFSGKAVVASPCGEGDTRIQLQPHVTNWPSQRPSSAAVAAKAGTRWCGIVAVKG